MIKRIDHFGGQHTDPEAARRAGQAGRREWGRESGDTIINRVTVVNCYDVTL